MTAATTTCLGPLWTWADHPALAATGPFLTPANVRAVLGTPELLSSGLSFSLPLLLILACHELGHWLACRAHRIPARPPFFLPAPIGIGTFGAFIRILAPVHSRRQLLDVGAAGPIAGFFALLPFLFWGLSSSVVVEASPVTGAIRLGEPLTVRLVGYALGLGEQQISLHPVAFAAWVGLLITAFNLLPVGQLDGGHVLYAAGGSVQRRLALPIWLTLLAAGFLWAGWWVWAAISLFIGLRHPRTLDERRPLDRRRLALAWLCAALFVLSLSPVPLAPVG